MTESATPAPAKQPGWQQWAAHSTAILAVLAALSSGRWGASNLQAILEQGKVNDTWAYYQAKSIKEHDAEQTRELAHSFLPGQPADRAASLEALRARMDAEARRETEEKAKTERDAHEFEIRRDQLVESSFWFELSFAGLQLGVILCTIAVGAKRTLPWSAGLVCGVLGLVLLVNGWHRFIHAPPSWYQGTRQQMSYQPGAAPPSRATAPSQQP